MHCAVTLQRADAAGCTVRRATHLVQARTTAVQRLLVPNISGSVPLQYSVYADLDCLSGCPTHTCTSTARGDAYKLQVSLLCRQAG